MEGEVTEALPDVTFRVKTQNEFLVLARLSGKMRLHNIRVLPKDRVLVEVSPYDLTRGRIVRRL